MSNRIYQPLLFLVLLFSSLTYALPFALSATTSSTPLLKEGQIVAENDDLYRILIKITPEGYYQVQNFYRQNQQKQTDRFIIKDSENLASFQTVDIYNLRQLIFDGALTLWFSNGTKYMSLYINEGNAEGAFERFHINGSPEITGHYLHGKPEGLWNYWNMDGQLEQKIYYKAGIRQWQKNTLTLKGL